MPRSLRGDLTKWCQEIQTGIYVGKVSAKVRELLWQKINENIGQGEATLVYNTNNELGYTMRTTRHDKAIVDADGIPLIKRLFQDDHEARHGFSQAYKYHQARIYQGRTRHTKAKNFVSLDLETTGLNPVHNQILSIGAVKTVNGKISEYYRLVKLPPGASIPQDIARVTNLNEQLVNTEGVNIKDALVELKFFVKDLPIVGYNLLFDERFLQTAIIRHNLIQLNNRMVDVLPYIKRTDKFCDNYRLSTVLNKYGIENEQVHNALSDAKATMKLVDKLIELQGFRI